MNADINIKNIILETNRLLLRPFKMSDLNDFYEYAKVWGVGQMAGWLPHQSIAQSQKILEKFIEGNKTFAIVYKNNNKVIGSIGIEELRNINEGQTKNCFPRSGCCMNFCVSIPKTRKNTSHTSKVLRIPSSQPFIHLNRW